MKKPTNERYCIVQDQSCHDYLIPLSKRKEWYKFLETEEAENGDSPDWARHFSGLISFENPKFE
jgi:hypothetical protein